MKQRDGSHFFQNLPGWAYAVFASLMLVSCTAKEQQPQHPEYVEALILYTTAAPGSSSVELVPPKGYHQAEETPERVFPDGFNMKANRTGMKTLFMGAEAGDKAWIEAYYCPETDTGAGLCTFRPIEVLFELGAPVARKYPLPDPAQ